MMRLKRIEAARFGRLFDATLGPLGDGLTVVLGPNEAGKSSFTALVRSVLYGFPTERSVSERPYLSEAGTREGRLVFESAEGEWVVERVAGVRGGPVSVRALRGPERPDLLAEVTGGVSEQAFKVVFGFGLAEMALIEHSRGSDDDIIARLYAAGAGLSVSPQEVRAALEAEAGELYRPRGSKPVINALAAEARRLRTEIGDLERAGAELAGERERLRELSTELEAARVRRDELAVRHRTLAEEARVLGALEDEVHEYESTLLGLRRAARTAAEDVASIVVDEAALELASEVGALADDLSSFRRAQEGVREAREQATTAASARDALFAEAGLTPAEGAAVDTSPATREGVREWSERLVAAAHRERSAADERDRTGAEAEALRATAPVPVPQAAVPAGGAGLLPWALVAVVGAVLSGLGAFTGQWVVAGAGLLLAGLGVVMAARARAAAPSAASGHDAERQAERLRELERRAEQARLLADTAAQTAADERLAWQEWRAGRGLAAASDPASAGRVVDLVAQARRSESDRVAAEARLEREQDQVEGYLARARVLAEVLAMPEPADPDAAVATVARMRERVDAAREARLARESAAERAASARERVAETEERQASAVERAQELIARLGVEGGLAELRASAEQAEIDARVAAERFDALNAECASLEERVGQRERDHSMGERRLELESVRERIGERAERYVELQLAARLLEQAQERYERERQPDVVREAERVFAAITGDVYPRLTVPLGGSAIEVFDASSRAKDTARLSTGTAEQLYLALRLALIGQLDAVGPGLPVLMDDVFANFDPERKLGAAAAVAELARSRQVVMFTCHPETAALLTEADPGAATLTLDRC